jgi:hypothetical protein
MSPAGTQWRNIPPGHCKSFHAAVAVRNGEFRGCSVPVDRGGRTEWVDND